MSGAHQKSRETLRRTHGILNMHYFHPDHKIRMAHANPPPIVIGLFNEIPLTPSSFSLRV